MNDITLLSTCMKNKGQKLDT